MLTEEGADLGCKDKQGLTPLHFAAGRGYLGVVQFLWSKGAEVDAEAPGKHLRPAPGAPLPAPADRWFSALSQHRTQRPTGCCPFADGRTPLHLAAQRGHPEVVRFFIQKGAWTDAYDAKDNTPLHLAARCACRWCGGS